LIADSLDMLADATVYAIGLYAVGRAARDKASAAQISGYLQLALGVLILVDISRRVFSGSDPVSGFMMTVGTVALFANVICLMLIKKHKDGEVHMRASWIFSANDVIANLGVIISGGLVWWLGSRWPDIIIGVIISFVILRGAFYILVDARKELEKEDSNAVYSNSSDKEV
jgi:Co/Zn/Cd efflux system component